MRERLAARKSLIIDGKKYSYYSLATLAEAKGSDLSRLPISIRILLESALRNYDGLAVTEAHINQLLNWGTSDVAGGEVPFVPARIILQDFTGVPAVVDLAAMREAMMKMGGNPALINPIIPVDLVIDHSLMVDKADSADALAYNIDQEFARNQERYLFLRWAQESFSNFRVIPPATGIIHQVNLEYLADVVVRSKSSDGATYTDGETRTDGEELVYPDSLVGTDSHTTMINGLGVLGWGVGGIEAEAGMLGQPLYFLAPEVVGFKLTGKLAEGVTATDLALTIVELLRKENVVGKIVEFYGEGIEALSLEDRATVANMAPEYGATMGYFPVDQITLDYMKLTGRDQHLIRLVETYYKEQGLYYTRDLDRVQYSAKLELDLGTVEASVAGPKRPQDRIKLSAVKAAWEATRSELAGHREEKSCVATLDSVIGATDQVRDGSVVIAALTSCTNTSNPSVMLAAGLVAEKALALGLKLPAYVKSSLTPGSRVVTRYLENAKLLKPLEKLGFRLAGYGCATCIGNSGPLAEEVARQVQDQDLTVVSVLSGNRNFEGRVHPLVKANYLASPPLVVLYALAGRIDIDLTTEAIAFSGEGKPVFMSDLWPTDAELDVVVADVVNRDIFADEYRDIYKANTLWNEIAVTGGELYNWDEASTYIQNPPFFADLGADKGATAGADVVVTAGAEASASKIENARILAVLSDSVTTDHISPAGNIAKDSPAGRYLLERGVSESEFNSYGSRRGNHEVMMRGTFANIRIRNRLVPDLVGGMTKYLPTGEVMSIYDAAMRYQGDGTPLVILAGKEYGTGSSRDWAAKGPRLLGVRAVIAESFERIHRSNLVGMGILPLELVDELDWDKLGLTGEELVSIKGLEQELKPQAIVTIELKKADGSTIELAAKLRLDSLVDIEYYLNGGILQTVLRELSKS
jgi:aconitate hydratase